MAVTIVTRSGKGSPLTHNEVDANFNNLNSGKDDTVNNLPLDTTMSSTADFIPFYDAAAAAVKKITPINSVFFNRTVIIKVLPDITKNASAKGAKTLDKCIKVLKEFNNNVGRPSCGILSIFYLLDKYDKIYICGMDGFKGGHWFGNKFLSNQEESDKMAARGIGAHNAIKEQEYIQYLIQDGKIIKLDE